LEQAIEHGDAARARAVREYSRLIERGRREFDRISPTLGMLEKSPDDADANLAAGRYYYWFKNDWPRGLPMLAIGSDPKLKDLANKDLARPGDPEALVAIGDGWWEFAEDQPSLQRTCLRSHACELYESALPSLTSLRRAAVRNRIDEFHNEGE